MRINILFTAVFLLTCCTQAQSSEEAAKRPNIIFVFIDDMGYGDLHSYGNAGVKTPNIDKLAEEGIRFTQFYVNSPICSPSRVAVTTGQYPLRWNIASFLADSSRNMNREMAHYLDPKAPILARILQDAGYYTTHVGKWHMGGQRNMAGAPKISEYGFNSSLTSFEGLGERLGLTFETRKWNDSNRFPLSVQQAKLGNGEVRWVKRHNEPQLFVERTLEEIQNAREKDQPFYINLWPDAVHLPVEAPPKLRGDGSRRAQYYGVIQELDKQLGRVFDHIRNNPDLKKNTIIVLASDNGPNREIGSTGGLRGHKLVLHEGGIREPFIVWAPDKINNIGKVNTNTVIAGMDLPPSLLSIAGVEAPDNMEFDGLNMSNALLGEFDKKRNEPLMWVRPPDFPGPDHEWPDLAIREGKWKLLVNIDGSNPELYNVETNPGETINLASKKSKKASDLKAKVLEWFQEIRSETSNSRVPWK